MTKPTEVTFTQKTETFHRLSTFPLVKDFVAYKLEVVTKISLPKNKVKESTHTTQGITTKHHAANLKNGNTTELAHPKDRWRLVDEEWLQKLTTIGFLNIKQGKDEEWSPYSKSGDVYDMLVADPNGLGNRKLVRLYTDGHMVFDTDGVPIPVARYFDYIGSGLHNGYYQLKKVVEILSVRDDIYFLDGHGYYLDSDERKILDIPHYNAEKDQTKFLNFIWAPSQEEYVKLWKMCLSMETEYASTRFNEAIKELDSLGIEVARKPKKVEEDYDV